MRSAMASRRRGRRRGPAPRRRASRPISTVAKGPSEPFSPRSCSRSTEPAEQRCGLAARLEHSKELGAAAEATATSATRPHRRQSDVPAGRLADWPGVHGLELVDVLGSGGMGVVFKARQVALDRDVAVKFLRDAHLSDSGRRERFLQEARAVARLRHPHLVQLYEFGEVPAAGGATSQPYLVLEYVSGGSLADLVRSSPQPPGRGRAARRNAGRRHPLRPPAGGHPSRPEAGERPFAQGRSRRGGTGRRGARPAIFSTACL